MFDVLKTTGIERSLSSYVERKLLEDYATRFPHGEAKILDKADKVTQKCCITKAIVIQNCNTKISPIREILDDYTRRSDRFKGREDYERIQKNWLESRVKALSGFNGITDIESAFDVLENIKESISK